MVAQENEEGGHLRPACVECTHRCNALHGDRDLEEEKFDPDRSWPHFRRKVTKMALHTSDQSALCIPVNFMEEYPNAIRTGKSITLEGPSGNRWKLGATQRSVLHSGWRAFAHDHHLKEHDQLTFRLTKPSYFVVDICDSRGDVRKTARKATVTGKYSTAAASRATAPLLPKDHSRKRKSMVESSGERWKTAPAKRTIDFNEPMSGGGARLRFSEITKRWENQESEKEDSPGDSREKRVITIDLDSEDDKAPEKSYKIARIIESMQEEEELIMPKSKPPAPRVIAKVGEEYILSDDEDDTVDDPVDGKEEQSFPKNDPEDDPVDEEEKQSFPNNDPVDDPVDEEEKQSFLNNEPVDDPVDGEEKQSFPNSDPLRQFTTIFNTKYLQDTTEDMVDSRMLNGEKGTEIESATAPSPDAQIMKSNEDICMVKDEGADDETHLTDHSQTDQTSEDSTTLAIVPEKKELQAYSSQQDIPKEVEGEFGTVAENAEVAQAVDESVPLKEKQMLSGGEPTLENPVEFPVTNTGDGGETDSMQHADDLDTMTQKENEELPLAKSNKADCIVGLVSASEAQIDLHVTETDPGTPKQDQGLLSSRDAENAKPKEAVLPVIVPIPELSTPEDEINSSDNSKNSIHVGVAEPLSKTSTNTCVLGSKRCIVTQGERAKALKAAVTRARKIQNPNFVAVMTSSHVYTDFIMDIPAEFAKQSNLPTKDVKVTLVCDEVPTNIKAKWLGSKDQLDSKGWMNFSRSHCLEEGDVCVFECLTTSASFRLGVYIVRVVKLRRPIELDYTRHYKVLKEVNAAD